MRVAWRVALFAVALVLLSLANAYLIVIVWRKIIRALKTDQNYVVNAELVTNVYKETPPSTLTAIFYSDNELKSKELTNSLRSSTIQPQNEHKNYHRNHHLHHINREQLSRQQKIDSELDLRHLGQDRNNEILKQDHSVTHIKAQSVFDYNQYKINNEKLKQHRHRFTSPATSSSASMLAENNIKIQADDLIKKNKKFNSIHRHHAIGNVMIRLNSTMMFQPRPKHVKTPVEIHREKMKLAKIRGGNYFEGEKLPVIRVTAAELRQLTKQNSPTNTVVKKNEEMTQMGMGGEINSNLTIVTALLDIGREKWPHYGRPFAKYHDFMRNVLFLRAPIIVFVDSRSIEFVQRVRDFVGLSHRTVIHEITIEDLPLQAYRRHIESIVDYELRGGGWHPNWDSAMRWHPETFNVDYDIVVNSKAYFLYNASLENYFGTEFFAWLDGGYGHGDSSYFPPKYLWRPKFEANRISLIKLTPKTDLIQRYGLLDLYRQDVAVVSGGFLAGDRATLKHFYQRYHWKVVGLLTQERMVDDDQTVLVLLINEEPDLFNIVHGDWFDAFKLF